MMEWLEALGHDTPFERHQAPTVWDRTVPLLAAVPGLIDLLKSPDPNVRSRAAMVLGKVGGQAQWALAGLRAALRETALLEADEEVRATAVHAVLQAGPQAREGGELGALVDSLLDELAVVRFHAAIALGDLGRQALPALATLIQVHLWDEHPAVRLEAGVALWKIDHRGALILPNLIKALSDDDEIICWMAADSLARIGPEANAAVPALRQAAQRTFKIGLVKTGVALALQRISAGAPAEPEGGSGQPAGVPQESQPQPAGA
jgi:HEAT repeat protein